MTIVDSDKMRDKCYQVVGILDPKEYAGQFDPTKVPQGSEEEKLQSLRNRDNLPDEVVFKLQDQVTDEFLIAPDTGFLPGSFIESNRISGTLIVNGRLGQIAFRNNDGTVRTTGAWSEESIEKKMRKILNGKPCHIYTKAGSEDIQPNTRNLGVMKKDQSRKNPDNSPRKTMGDSGKEKSETTTKEPQKGFKKPKKRSPNKFKDGSKKKSKTQSNSESRKSNKGSGKNSKNED